MVYLTPANRSRTAFNIYAIKDNQLVKIIDPEHPHYSQKYNAYHNPVKGSDPAYEIVYYLSERLFGKPYKLKFVEI